MTTLYLVKVCILKKLKRSPSKKIFFLAGLPRAGNTILTSILNQNPDVCCTPNSITLEIIKDLFLLKQQMYLKTFQITNR